MMIKLWDFIYPANFYRMNVAAAVVGSAVVGGALSSNAAGKAANSQEKSAAEANATQRYMYDTTRADNAPFLANGTAANNKLSYLLGIGGTSANNPNAPGWMTLDQAKQIAADNYAKTNPLGTGGTVFESIASGRTRQSDYEATAKAIMDANNAAITQPIAENDPAYGSLLKKFDQNDLNNDVPYSTGINFALQQGQQGVNRLAAANGSQLSGATLKALQKSGANIGNQYAGDAYNRYTSDQTNTYNKLAGISGAGQTASAQVGSAGTNAANQISNNQTALGNARGASAIAQGNAWGNALSTGANAYQNQSFLNSLNQSNPYAGTGYSNSDIQGLQGYQGIY